MAAIVVGDLYAKLKRLIDHGVVDGWGALAAEFGVAPGTVKWWGQGDALRERDRLPARHLPAYLALVARALPQDASVERVRDIAFAPLGLFDSAIRGSEAIDLLSLLSAEADRSTMTLVRGDQLPLVEIEREDLPSLLRLSKPARFRIECMLSLANANCLALQLADNSWCSLPTSRASDPPRLLVPGRRPDGEPAFVIERNAAGLHRYFVLETLTSPPPALLQPHPVVLGLSDSAALAAFYRDQPAKSRAAHLLELAID